jgi:high affinity Mn2+ porin
LTEPGWAARYGFFQMPKVANGTATDLRVLEAWGMVTEFERRFAIREHPGAVRLLAFLNRANMGSYQAAVDNPTRPADIEATRAYRLKYGFGINVEQELMKNVGAFARLGWSDGETEAWVFTDVDQTATFGLSIKGDAWGRADDTFAIAGVFNGISRAHQDFLSAGGTGILVGDSALSYGWEQIMETYYDFRIWKTVHATVDYQFVGNPAFNRDRGPVSVIGLRLHWEL